MSLSICNCYLKLVDQYGNAPATIVNSVQGQTALRAELTFEPRKTQVNSSDAVYLGNKIRDQFSPSKAINGLLYNSVVTAPATPISIAYTGSGTAGSEVVTVTGSAISVQIESGVSTISQIKTAILASAAAAALVDCILVGIGSTTQTTLSATNLSDYYAFMQLAETTTNNQNCVFTLEWSSSSNYGSIVFDPIKIPNSASVDLSTLLTVSRG